MSHPRQGFSSTSYEYEVTRKTDEELLRSFARVSGVYESFGGSEPPESIEQSVLFQDSVTDKQYIILKRECIKRDLDIDDIDYKTRDLITDL